MLPTTENFEEDEREDADNDDDGADDVVGRGQNVQYQQLQNYGHHKLQVLHLSNTCKIIAISKPGLSN